MSDSGKSDVPSSSSSLSDSSWKKSQAGRRLHKELTCLTREPPEGITLSPEVLDNDDMTKLTVGIDGPKGTLYDGEKFHLQFKFGVRYPFDSPEVIFVGDSIPIHPHVYSNGHICLSILTEDWSPALSIQSVCLSVSSMLASAKEKIPPPDNSIYIRTCSKNPKKTRWWYHDDKV